MVEYTCMSQEKYIENFAKVNKQIVPTKAPITFVPKTTAPLMTKAATALKKAASIMSTVAMKTPSPFLKKAANIANKSAVIGKAAAIASSSSAMKVAAKTMSAMIATMKVNSQTRAPIAAMQKAAKIAMNAAKKNPSPILALPVPQSCNVPIGHNGDCGYLNDSRFQPQCVATGITCTTSLGPPVQPPPSTPVQLPPSPPETADSNIITEEEEEELIETEPIAVTEEEEEETPIDYLLETFDTLIESNSESEFIAGVSNNNLFIVLILIIILLLTIIITK